MAKSDAKNNVTISWWLTCSGFWKRDTIQNRTIAPPIRKSLTTNGVTAPPAIIVLVTGDIIPHIVFAPSMEAWPLQSKFIVVKFSAKL